MEALDDLAAALRIRLIERARTGDSAAAGGGGLEAQVRSLVEAEAAALPEADRAELCERVVRLATGLGPLEPLLADPAVDEVMVNGAGRRLCGAPWPRGAERRGRSTRTTSWCTRSSASSRRSAAGLTRPRRCAMRAWPDGSRVNVVIPPLALDGPCLTIRRFRREGFSLDDLVANGTLSPSRLPICSLSEGPRASVDPGERRHRLREDDHALRALGGHPRRASAS